MEGFVLMVPWLWRPGELYLSRRIESAAKGFAENANINVVEFFSCAAQLNIGICG